MNENLLPPAIDALSIAQYGGVTLNLARRWQVYNHAVPPRDLYAEITDSLELEGNERILDIGCSDARYLRRLRADYNHEGSLIGMDIDTNLFTVPQYLLKRGEIDRLDLMVGSAQELPLRDGSIDIVTALFMLYHVPDPLQALDEFHRVLRPDGKLAVATSGPRNKFRHRLFEHMAAFALGCEPPRHFNYRFDTVSALGLLSLQFSIDRHIKQLSPIHIYPKQIDDYYESLYSMRSAFRPSPRISHLASVINKYIKPYVDEDIKKQGYFKDWIHREVFICQPK